jgi:DNA (cytosine-5)-methyltransferase 1
VLQYILNNLQNSPKLYDEVLVDLKKFAQLLEDDISIGFLNSLPLKIKDCKSIEKLSETFNSAVENLSEQEEFFLKYTERFNSHKRKLNFIDFFCGAGGISEGFCQAGYEPTFANDIDSNSLNSFYLNHFLQPSSVWHGDILELVTKRKEILESLEKVEIVVGGPPCQGFSTANRQRLIDDPRNKLYKGYLCALSIIKPKFFLIENVVGMANKIDEIAEDITSMLGSKYKFDYKILKAVDMGIPQARKRFILIANRLGIDPSAIFSKIENRCDTCFSLKDAINDLPALGVKKEKNSPKIENEIIGYKIRKKEKNITTKFGNAINLQTKSKFVLNHKNRFNNKRDVEIFTRLPQGCNSLHESISEIMPYSNRNHIFKDKYYKLDASEPCKTITSHMRLDCNMYIHPTQSRGLSPREAARIQTFPDHYFFLGSQNSWYHQIGNSVPVVMSRRIAEAIKDYL